ncbi:M20/M25/M40 family metallo-hydrolase [Aquirufa ecclesiirivi]|uniref:M20/M25/M40 family metallo-hydrolase n=1 Tax=Aquirufa ecclesiirivi TaxID=2715124 RepID=UPI002E781AA1|nr:M20/M25/M40 family metallo-hydrolase [Aquirufa ecclesiirivi]
MKTSINNLTSRLSQLVIGLSLMATPLLAQQNNHSSTVNAIVKEATENSQLKRMAHELIDGIGPRLVGSTKMLQASDWAMNQYKQWGIDARRENYGTWRGWDRGISSIDMVSPWIKSLEGTQLAFSPATKKPKTGETIILADVADSVAFKAWLPQVKGKFVLISMPQLTGRPDYNWQEFAQKESFEAMKKERDAQTEAWRKRISKTGLTNAKLALALEEAGALGIVSSTWSNGFGVNKIFAAFTRKIPTVSVALEDYGLLYRLTESGNQPKITVNTLSKELGTIPTFNTHAEIKGIEKPNEYVMLSAHLDSWDGATGATDNGTGTLVMLETMRILKKVYPNPKRTILVGHWGSEEQGLNGSRAFVEDHPEIVANLQALFNQDNGTGRVVNLGGSGFAKAKDYLSKWLAATPDTIKNRIKTTFPGTPGGGGSDFASFVAVGTTGFNLSSLSWSYGAYTWHTNRDNYDKIVFDDVKSNAILTAILVYMACEEPEKISTEKADLPAGQKWPSQVKSKRSGGTN